MQLPRYCSGDIAFGRGQIQFRAHPRSIGQRQPVLLDLRESAQPARIGLLESAYSKLFTHGRRSGRNQGAENCHSPNRLVHNSRTRIHVIAANATIASIAESM
jgi:hypothetical protein